MADEQNAGERVSMTQDELNDIIEARLARERQRWEQKLGGPGAADELERLRKAAAERKRLDDEARGNYERALAAKDDEWGKQIKEREDRLAALRAELRKDRVRGAIIAAAAEARALKPDQLADLLEGRRVTLDEESLSVVVLDPAGKPWFPHGKPASVQHLVEAYLAENPHLAQASGTGGAGSRGGASTSEAGGGVQETAEMAAAKKRFDDARARAERSKQPADITAAQKAANEVQRLQRAKAS